MKVLPFKIPKPENHSLLFQVDKGKEFYDKLHRHEEIQVSIVLSGEGDLIVGDTYHRYQADDIVVIGGNLPHLFKSDTNASPESHMLSLFFTKDSFGKFFFDLMELKSLDTLFKKIPQGIRISENKEQIKGLFLEVQKASALDRLILFLRILNIIAQSRSEALATFVFERPYGQDEGTRMNDVMSYAMSEFQKDITLAEISDLANMTPNAFCRYFKQRTNKTFFQFLMEIRLEHACRLLLKNREMTVAEISDSSGFKNISNFNRKFKSHTGETPSSFRKSHLLSR